MSQTVYEIQHAETDEEILRCFELLQLLRPHLEENSFVEKVKKQKEEGYHLLYISDDGGVKSVASYRFAHHLAWDKILYIDELITDPDARGIGFGTHLLKHLKTVAKEAKCHGIHLDTGIDSRDAHRLYLNMGMKITGLHLALGL